MPRTKKKPDDRYSTANVNIAISMHGAAKDAITKVAEAMGVGVSEFMRAAAAAYMRSNGHKAEAAHVDGGGS